MLLTAVLAALHIVFAMAWLGGGIIFGFVIAPRTAKLSLGSSRQFFVTIGPAIARYFQAVAGLTILFGLLLLYDLDTANPGQLSFGTTWGTALLFGMGTALAAFLISEFVATPALTKVVAVCRTMPDDAHEPPPELLAAGRTAGRSAFVVIVLLAVTLGFMAAAGFY